MKSKGQKRDKGRDYEAESKHTQTEWVVERHCNNVCTTT